mmetsp:Transcript_11770/g.25479  ORF Transcript_11770/g.25479 Transcript_11770/m.25479 type:complete len:260 (+) Transcript_11770:149-928(+)
MVNITAAHILFFATLAVLGYRVHHGKFRLSDNGGLRNGGGAEGSMGGGEEVPVLGREHGEGGMGDECMMGMGHDGGGMGMGMGHRGEGMGMGHHGCGMGMGHHGGNGGKGGMGHDKCEMMKLIHKLLHNHDLIAREYEDTYSGIKSHTYSNDTEVVSRIQSHVYQMTRLMGTEDDGICFWDNLFREAFDLRGFHNMEVTNTTDGVRVNQSVVEDVNDDGVYACVRSVIQAHAEVVSRFVDRGMSEMHVNHPVPEECKAL